ncbi:monosaccharide ABC transporter ATP-binding protein, CUT2 family [Candidatus Moduliflexus flocculans]|uniref:Monosaccharide ABC transporter ATP-binding protein, CUT2 family n=1 Tax=Candidatus Moduliflexus flocculans TaxID=1499966 RepID=A0A081BNU4_9BACT|nr:monosaccharide ABC transporter ATP-binding protein, CUT2 family [Candidatus Moduliflexus flocculans]
MAHAANFLEMRSVSKEFFGNHVLTNVNFAMQRGEILGLVGENGAGKTTLMKILFGMPVIQQTGGFSGEILLEGKPVNFASPLDALDAGIGMVHQEFSLIPGFTATENIVLNTESLTYNIIVELFGDRLKNLDTSKNTQRAQAAIRKLGVQLDPQMLVSEMPVGHKQFTEIARELDRQNIKLIVLDEPTAVLTESEADILLHSIRALAAEGIAFILISHRLQEIMDVTHRVLVLRDGSMVQDVRTADTSITQIAEWMVGRELHQTINVQGTDFTDRACGEPLLQVENLWVDMPGETVRNVSFVAHKGEILGIGGLAGQGKLGIPNGIMGLHVAGGNVRFKGKSVPLNDPRAPLDLGFAFVSEDRRGVGLLLEEPLDWNIVFTAMQTQNKYLKRYLGGWLTWRDEAALERVAQEYIQALEIKCTSPKQLAQELSGGNQQKICLAKAFALEPELLFVSEPTRGIDIGAKKIVLDTLRKYNQERCVTIVMISSELEEMRSVCDRIAIVDEGRIVGILPASAPSTEFGKMMVGRGGV